MTQFRSVGLMGRVGSAEVLETEKPPAAIAGRMAPT